MIDVKATRRDAGAAPSANPYRIAEESISAARPLAFAALLSALVVYFRSLFLSEPAAASSAEGPAASGPEDPLAADAPQMTAVPAPATFDAQAAEKPQPAIADALASPQGRSPSNVAVLVPNGAGSVQQAALSLPVFAPPELPLPAFPLNDLGDVAANDNLDSGAPALGQLADFLRPDGDEGATDTRNRAPRISGPVYLGDAAACAVVFVSLADLLRNATDPDGDRLSIRNIKVSSGTLTQELQGWLYDPAATGPVTFTYEISDGALSVFQTAYLDVVRQRLEGGAGDDLMVGTPCGDDIDGGAGSDTIDGRGGDDVIHGGDGDDHILGGDGHDVIYAGAGADVVFGGAGNDSIWGGAGDDRLFGGTGDDIVHGGDGNDLIEGNEGADLLFGDAGGDEMLGGDGDDRIFGGDGDDDLAGEAGDDVVMGEAGDDRLDGGDGDDVLSGGPGADVVLGGSGDDVVIGDLDEADDLYEGGEGLDTLDYSHATSSLVFDLVAGDVRGAQVGRDSISGFELYVGGRAGDHFIAGTSAGFRGGGGGDLYEFGRYIETAAGPPTAYEIFDFVSGDRIRISRYEIFEKVIDSLEDRFEDVYGGDLDDDELPIRIRHERTDEMLTTFIEADLDGDQRYELSVSITGNLNVIVAEMV